ncbi:pyridoxamine 5'-phosphate oxidase family protein [Catenulispora sp. NF23]|uniref:pyridoxamine 5'-phosphate oxidase family protein n=1 Tax=Catenulispora pinistramenti TaxID=2705254 RepID=UPI001BA4E503|nr:pyridoxamine 5'-phosphate oxidase family protein [Catenulispora pinistramenti]MBS2531734.1 pyridoxamine 5'-phosphate oxidase family protein [Catenulispora pinistramenti]
MSHDERALGELSERECLDRLASTPVGRIAFSQNALPAVVPVNFVLDDGHILFRTAPGSELDTAVRGAVVAFEADDIDPGTRTGWSVLVVGRCSHETDAAVIERLDHFPLDPWLPDPTNHFVRICCDQITGRILGADHVNRESGHSIGSATPKSVV